MLCSCVSGHQFVVNKEAPALPPVYSYSAGSKVWNVLEGSNIAGSA